MSLYRLTDQAAEQIARVRAWSVNEHGPQHASNNEDLIRAAIDDIAADPRRFGATGVSRPAGVWVYELRHSRTRLPRNRRIRDPWHKIVYRPLPDGVVDILAIVGLSYPSGRAARQAIRDG